MYFTLDTCAQRHKATTSRNEKILQEINSINQWENCNFNLIRYLSKSSLGNFLLMCPSSGVGVVDDST